MAPSNMAYMIALLLRCHLSAAGRSKGRVVATSTRKLRCAVRCGAM